MKDPVVEEVQKIRSRHAERFKGDWDAIVRDLKDVENKSKRKMVTLPPKKILTKTGTGG